MMSTNNILSPANGKPIIVPTQDIVLGLYYLSLIAGRRARAKGMVFGDVAEVQQALTAGVVSLHAKVKCRIVKMHADGELKPQVVETTPWAAAALRDPPAPRQRHLPGPDQPDPDQEGDQPGH